MYLESLLSHNSSESFVGTCRCGIEGGFSAIILSAESKEMFDSMVQDFTVEKESFIIPSKTPATELTEFNQQIVYVISKLSINRAARGKCNCDLILMPTRNINYDVVGFSKTHTIIIDRKNEVKTYIPCIKLDNIIITDASVKKKLDAEELISYSRFVFRNNLIPYLIADTITDSVDSADIVEYGILHTR